MMPPATGGVPSAGLGLASGTGLLSACLQTPPSSAFPLGLGARWGIGTQQQAGRPRKPGQRALSPCHPQEGAWWRRPQSQAGESSREPAAQEAAGHSPEPRGKHHPGGRGLQPRAPGKGCPGGCGLQPRASGKRCRGDCGRSLGPWGKRRPGGQEPQPPGRRGAQSNPGSASACSPFPNTGLRAGSVPVLRPSVIFPDRRFPEAVRQ